MTKRQALGKGLGALIADADTPTKEKFSKDINNLPVHRIAPNRYQPRKTFNDNSIQELSQSIKEKGILQPIIVTKTDNGYELIVGERRLRAVKMLGWSEIPCIIKEITDEDKLEIALIENIQREDLNPIEEAESIDTLLKKLNCTHEIISKKLGLSRAAITNKVRLLNLPDKIKEHLIEEKISAGHARAILGVNNKELLEGVLNFIEENGLNVRKTEEIVQYVNNENQLPIKNDEQNLQPLENEENTENIEDTENKIIEEIEIDEDLYETIKNKEKMIKSDNWIYLENNLSQNFETKVRITGYPERGKIEIFYSNQEELEKIVNHLKQNL